MFRQWAPSTCTIRYTRLNLRDFCLRTAGGCTCGIRPDGASRLLLWLHELSRAWGPSLQRVGSRQKSAVKQALRLPETAASSCSEGTEWME